MATDSSNSLNVLLDPTLFEFVREQASAAGYSNPADYVGHLIESARQLHAERKLEAVLVDGLESGAAGPMSELDWDALRQRARDRNTHRGRGE